VTDRHGNAVLGFRRGGFRVLEDGVEQEVSAFSWGDAPMSVGLIFDASGSMATKLPMARLAVAEFLKTTNPEDEFFLLPFDSRPRPVTGFTNNAEVILNEVGRTVADGSTALLDAVYVGLRELQMGHNPRRALIIISDGEDNHSQQTRRTLDTILREADVQIYAIGIHQLVYSRYRRLKSGGAELLERLCSDTGGRSFEVDDQRELPAVGARIGLELRNEYLLAYRPTNQNWDGKYRHIEVKLVQSPEVHHLKAYWRRGYYGTPGRGK
jgi:VWFA-related protein